MGQLYTLYLLQLHLIALRIVAELKKILTKYRSRVKVEADAVFFEVGIEPCGPEGYSGGCKQQRAAVAVP